MPIIILIINHIIMPIPSIMRGMNRNAHQGKAASGKYKRVSFLDRPKRPTFERDEL